MEFQMFPMISKEFPIVFIGFPMTPIDFRKQPYQAWGPLEDPTSAMCVPFGVRVDT